MNKQSRDFLKAQIIHTHTPLLFYDIKENGLKATFPVYVYFQRKHSKRIPVYTPISALQCTIRRHPSLSRKPKENSEMFHVVKRTAFQNASAKEDPFRTRVGGVPLFPIRAVCTPRLSVRDLKRASKSI